MISATVVDVGTGSGNIVLSLAKHKNVFELHAVDISTQALEIAHENAMRNDIHKPIHWHQGDLLGPLMQAGVRPDMIVANLPYVCTGDLSTLSPEVRWEPALALDGGRSGLAYIYQLIVQAAKTLAPEGVLLLEIGHDQGPAVLETLHASRLWKDPQLYHDLAGLPRIIRAQKGALVGSVND
jgi:release factor glutamine methyltransferase